ncbi:adenylate/guanylate cyclase domain-containing protein [Labrenzia sp. CE80]|uniref:adenylate/guanylate cyclase domain-containing protein n=1 Tax=Labrenzia sp. CE80 TaxID=1788986 RepID=UPI00129B936C|nr:adenylate/guanylate cyclase domain-containing protein [Labrenzia sp. CE80]
MSLEPVSTELLRSWRQFRIPVGVALGLVFSVMLLAICSVIIGFQATSDRKITGRLLGETGMLMVEKNRSAVEDFFEEQEVAIGVVATALASADTVSDVENMTQRMRDGLPQGATLEIAVEGAQREGWREVAFNAEQGKTVLTFVKGLENGDTLLAHYPVALLRSRIAEMRWRPEQRPFVLTGQDEVLVFDSTKLDSFVPSADHRLPRLADLVDSPISGFWSDASDVHQIPGQLAGRIYSAPPEGRYAVIYEQVEEGPASGWIIGSLFRAQDYGTAIDQTRAVVYTALVALAIGVGLSFFVGRWLGRPLSNLAETSSQLRELDFAHVHQLPSSHLSELDDVNIALNGSMSALSAFARYVPSELVSRLIQQGKAEPGLIETRQMTIVFTDLAGFTTRASHMTAEETASFLNHHFEVVSDAIAAEHGTIDKYIGDGVMAFWGAPSDQPDHAALAVASVRSLAKTFRESESPDIRIRIGIHSGEVVVGNIGSSRRMNYTVIGDAVNVAARLQEYGKQIDPGARVVALASRETMSQIESGSSAVSVGQISLRGRDEEISVFRIA